MTATTEKPSSVSAAIKAYRADCKRIKRAAERDFPRCHIVGRGVELIALNQDGEREDDLGGPEYLAAKELTVKGLKETAAHWLKHYSPSRNGDTISALHIAGGFDIYDSFSEYMESQRGGGWADYDIYGDWAGQDIPLTLLTD